MRKTTTELGELTMNDENGSLVLSAKGQRLDGSVGGTLERARGALILYGLKRLDVYQRVRGTHALVGTVRAK